MAEEFEKPETIEEPLPGKSPAGEASVTPTWGNTTKLVVGLTMVAAVGGLILRFRTLIGPLLLAVMLAYLLYPVADFTKVKTRMPWRLVVTIYYLLMVAMVLGSATAGGVALFSQLNTLIKFIEGALVNLPKMVEQFTSAPIYIGPFEIPVPQLDIASVLQQLLSMVQPMLSRAGTLLATVAGSAAEFVGWLFFILLISYFILAESGGIRNQIIKVEIPGYTQDFRRIGHELMKIWNAFGRGQTVVVLITIVVYTLVLALLGNRFPLQLGVIAGVARFVPYVGPAITWTTYGLVSYFQGSTLFGMDPLPYTILVVGLAYGLDVVMDYFVQPRIMADTLKIHPAAVMVSALVGANLFGVIGVVLAAPVAASLVLVFNYVLRKMFDLDPWQGLNIERNPAAQPRIRLKFIHLPQLIRSRIKQEPSEKESNHVGPQD